MRKTPAIKAAVKKHVAAIHTSGQLSLLERKLVNIMLLNAYDDLLTKTIHSMPVSMLLEMLEWSQGGGVEDLKSALINIQKTVLEYDVLNKNGKSKNWASSTLLAGAKIEGGICYYQYSQFLAEELANPEVYATINLGVQNQFRGGYALTLYENCLRFKNVGSTGWIGIELWRTILGADSVRYDDFKHLSKEVIKRSVSEVNQVSDIEIEPEYQREMRKVKNIRFSIKNNPQQTIFDDGSLADDAIRQTPTFKRLLEHGIGEKLALVWMVQDPMRAEKAVSHVEDIDKNRPLKNTAGYIRTVFEGGGAIGKSPIKVKKAAKAEADKQISVQSDEIQQTRNKAVNAAIKRLSDEDMREYAAAYIAESGADRAKSYDSATAKFKNALERVPFMAWLRRKVLPL